MWKQFCNSFGDSSCHCLPVIVLLINIMHAVHTAGKFNQLVYQYPIRIPERFSLVIRSLLTQEGICFTLKPDFKFLEVSNYLYLYQFMSLSNQLFVTWKKICIFRKYYLSSWGWGSCLIRAGSSNVRLVEFGILSSLILWSWIPL